MIYNNGLELIGNTPILKLNNLVNDNMASIYLKLEKYNIGGSIKDRIALKMIECAEKEGKLKKGSTIIEPTSGNTGIGLSLVGRLKGYRVIIVMPDTMSKERREIIKAYGAELVLSDGSKGMNGAISKAHELSKEIKNSFIPQQFENQANPQAHYENTAEEILQDVKDLDVFVASVGTGGTVTGIGKRLKEYNDKIQVIAVEPSNSSVLSGGKPGSHKIQGIGAGFIPKTYNSQYVDKVITVSDEEAFEASKELTSKEGILVGISTGANVAVALKIANEIGKGKKIVTISPDGGEKYLSTGIYE